MSRIPSPPPEELIALLPELAPEAIIGAWKVLNNTHKHLLLWHAKWLSQRHDYQIPPVLNRQVDPPAPWHIWLMLAGRGAGKSRTGAEWAGWESAINPKTRTLVSAPTAGDLRDVCFEGESGLLNVIPPALIRNYSRSLNELYLTNETLIKGIPASEPERFRGPQWHRCWADELCAWGSSAGGDEDAWDMIMFSLRLGQNPQMFISTTPKPRPLLHSLLRRSDVVVTRANTYDNIANLAPTFRKQILQYEGTKIGRQEIHAEVLDPEEDGVVKRSQIRRWPANRPLPDFEIVLYSLDTSFSEKSVDDKGRRDPTAASVWGGFRYEGKPGIMLLDCWEEMLSFPELMTKTRRELAARYGGNDKSIIKPQFGPIRPLFSGKGIDFCVIEDKGSGISLRQVLAAEGIITHPYNPGRADKLTRLHIVSPLFAQGYVWVVESENRPNQFRSWAEPLVSQLCSYSGEGTIAHDDLLDTTTQALRVINDKWLRALTIAPSGAISTPARNVVDFPARRVNPYAV